MLFVGTSIIHPSTEGVFLLCNILDLLIYSFYNSFAVTEKKIAFIEIHIIMAFGRAGNGNYGIIS